MLTMRRWVTILITIILPLKAIAGGKNNNPFYHSPLEQQSIEAFMDNKTVHPLLLLLAADENSDMETFIEAEKQIADLSLWFYKERDESGKETKALKKLFRKIHKEVFLEYELYTPLGDVFEHGIYNCVSGTAYYSYLLVKMGYQPEIWETPFHVYLSFLNHSGERIMIETTDPDFGFITSKSRMAELESLYSQFDGNWGIEHAKIGNIRNEKQDASSSFKRRINFLELNGLQYLNRGITSMLTGEMEDSYSDLSKADFFYPSPRTKALMSLFDH